MVLQYFHSDFAVFWTRLNSQSYFQGSRIVNASDVPWKLRNDQHLTNKHEKHSFED
jgi:hypothetical protein